MTNVSWGMELRTSRTPADAVPSRSRWSRSRRPGEVAASDGLFLAPRLRVIPARETIYVGSDGTFKGAFQIGGIRVSIIRVGSRPSKRSKLPPVSDVHLDTANRTVTATVTNSYRTSISPYEYSPSVVPTTATAASSAAPTGRGLRHRERQVIRPGHAPPGRLRGRRKFASRHRADGENLELSAARDRRFTATDPSVKCGFLRSPSRRPTNSCFHAGGRDRCEAN